MPLSTQSSLEEVAAIVSEALVDAGIVATLTGGSAVSLYSSNAYQSKDLDFVSAAIFAELSPVMFALGFKKMSDGHGSSFEHPNIDWYVEFVAAPISIGDKYIADSECIELDVSAGRVRIISPTHSVMDRLAWYLHHNDPQSLDQAVLVAKGQNIDWQELEEWFFAEGGEPEQFDRFKSLVGRT